MIFGLVGTVIFFKARYKEKVNILYALIAVFVPEIILTFTAAVTGEWLTLWSESGNIGATDAMKISHSILIMGIIFLLGAFFIYSTDIKNYHVFIVALPLFAVTTKLFSIYRVVYYIFPLSDISNINYFLLYLQQRFITGSFFYTIPLDLIYWLIDLGLLFASVVYAIRELAHREMREKQKILAMDTRKLDPFKYPNIAPGEFEEVYFEDEDEEEKKKSNKS